MPVVVRAIYSIDQDHARWGENDLVVFLVNKKGRARKGESDLVVRVVPVRVRAI